ncbi:hypothetical protein [Nocardia sp. NPDC019395]
MYLIQRREGTANIGDFPWLVGCMIDPDPEHARPVSELAEQDLS